MVCVNAADDALADYDIGDTHVYTMYICPPEVEFGTAAGVGDMGGYKSWYSDEFGSSPYVQMHEMGHNLMFFHSGEKEQGHLEYGDPTGVMGGMYVKDPQWGRMCFNAAKTFTTGWYADHHASITPEETGTYIGNLVDVNAASNGDIRVEDDVVVQVKGSGEKTLYFMLHRLEGITRDMKPDNQLLYATLSTIEL